MTGNQSAPSPWWDYIERNLEYRNLTTGDLAREVNVDRSRLTAWRKGAKISIPTARAIARLFQVSVFEVLVAAGMLTQQEADYQPASTDPTDLSDEQLIAELRRRLKQRAETEPPTEPSAD
ncbi:helix-turn-helix transcriptional regulator [Actinosynnema pretiosum]|uniref:helix-turn-helix transcriptional regulator n=1 Tax=Actinosynnema pretiosum TaxID=42197 RepID=UPI001E41176A|nr:helix-turn-helix transcriptional regulator [Actinosynnema pretiosum]